MKAIGAAASGQLDNLSNKGRVLADSARGLFILCDGVRGHVSSGRAARMALERVEQRVAASGFDAATPVADVLAFLADVVRDCSETIHQAGVAAPEHRGMSSTLTVVWVLGALAYIAHVGHSRVYLSRLNHLHRLTKDHTVTMELVEMGMLPPEQAPGHAMSNVLTRTVGAQEAVLADTLSIELVPGDRLFLCDSGVARVMDAALLAGDDCAAIARRLVDASLAGGQRDTANAVALEVEDEATACRLASGGEEALLKLDVLRGVFLFRDLDMSELARVVELCEPKEAVAGELVIRDAAAGEVFIHDGVAERSMYLILDGELEVLKHGVVLARLGKGGHVGEMALVSGAARSADVRALRPSRLLVIRNEPWQALLHRAPAIGVKLLAAMSEELSRRLASMNERV